MQRVEIDEIVEETPYFKARTFEIEERTRDPFRVNVYVQKQSTSAKDWPV